MISQPLRYGIGKILPTAKVFSQSETAFLERAIAQQIHLTRSFRVDWSHIKQFNEALELKQVIPALENFLNYPLNRTNHCIYAFLIFKSFRIAIKTEILSLLNNYHSIHWGMAKILIWNPTEGYVLENNFHGIAIGLINKCDDPIPHLILNKNSNTYTFLRNKSAFYEFIKTFGIEIFTDDEASTILAEFQSRVSVTPWKNIDWNKCEEKICIGQGENNIMPTLQKMIKGPFDEKAYVVIKQLEAPLMRIKLTPEIAQYRHLWAPQFYGTFLFNLEVGYIIEIDLQRNITVGLIPKL